MAIGPVTWTNMSHMVLRTPTVGSAAVPSSVSSHQQQENERLQMEFVAKQMGKLRGALDKIRDSWRRTAAASETRAAGVTSGLNLQLVPGTAATLTSSEEVNATPTSFTPRSPTWSGTSTADSTVGGVYDGDQGDDTLTFTVARGGTIGNRNIRVAVTDSGGAWAGTIRVGRNDNPGDVYTLPNGLEVSFTAGDLVQDDTFTVDVSATVGSTVDPGAAFDGEPLLEAGYAVTTGSFTVNGEVINVLADDSINSVLGRINQSIAGVTAIFDLATETVSLIQESLGAAHDITLAADTSGFLAATKLDTATVVPGVDGDAQRPLGDLPVFAGVSAGSILINGTAISIDPATDSLEDLVNRITASAAGVTASIDPSGQRLMLVSDDAETPLVLDDNGTGLLPALVMTEGTINPRAASSGVGMSRSRSRILAEATRDAIQAINSIFTYEAPGGEPASFLEQARLSLQSALEGAGKADRNGFIEYVGLEMDFEAPSGQVLSDSRRLETRLATAFHGRTALTEFFFFGQGHGEREGLIGLLEAGQDKILKSLELTAGYRGLVLDDLA